MASLPPEQMFELMKQMKWFIQHNPQEARQLLLHNPQLAYALLQAQVVMKIVDLETAQNLLHRASRGPSLIATPPPPAEQPRPSHGGPPPPPRPGGYHGGSPRDFHQGGPPPPPRGGERGPPPPHHGEYRGGPTPPVDAYGARMRVRRYFGSLLLYYLHRVCLTFFEWTTCIVMYCLLHVAPYIVDHE